jgi:hypothetical protein
MRILSIRMKTFQKKTVKGRRMCLDLDRSRRGGGWRCYETSRKDNTQIKNSVNAVLYRATHVKYLEANDNIYKVAFQREKNAPAYKSAQLNIHLYKRTWPKDFLDTLCSFDSLLSDFTLLYSPCGRITNHALTLKIIYLCEKSTLFFYHNFLS